MATATCSRPEATPTIDPRSFHVFEFQGERLLFDRQTGTTSVVNEPVFELLKQIEGGAVAGDAAVEVAARYPETGAADFIEALADLQRTGFFRFTDATPASEDELSILWNHKPRRIQMLMAEGCNLGCRYCYQWRNGTNQKKTLMPWNVARAAVDYLVWRSGGRPELQVTFFGGEPLLNYPMIRRVVDYCKGLEAGSGRRFTFELITNGTLLTPDVVDFLVEHRFLLFVSLDGWREMHEYNRPSLHGEDLYDTIVRNAVYANEQYEKHGLPRVKVRANLTNRFHDRHRVAKYLESLGFKLIGIGAIEPLPHGNPSPAAMTEEQMDALHELSTGHLLEGLEKMRRGETLSPFEAKSFTELTQPLKRQQWLGVTCGVCRNTAVVDNRGNMYPCHRYGEMQSYRIGSVFTGLDRDLVMDYYRKVNTRATTECHDCWIRDYCGGGCAWNLSAKDGTIHSPTATECRRRRHSMERSLWIRKELRTSFPARFGEQPSPDRWTWTCQVNDDGGLEHEHEEEMNFDGETAHPARPNRDATSELGRANSSLDLLPIAGPPRGTAGCCSNGSAASSCGCGNSISATIPAERTHLLSLLPVVSNSASSGSCGSCSDCGSGGCGSSGEEEAVFVLERRSPPA